MARIAGKNTEQTIRDMKRAAFRLIARHGFSGMNLRMLGTEVGVKAGSFYNHIESKQQLLHTLMLDTLHALLLQVDQALAGAVDPLDALQRFVRFHVEYHAAHRDEVRVGNGELRSLSAEARAEVEDLRRAYEARLADIVQAGVEKGQFAAVDVQVTSYALIAMLSGVSQWYDSAGRLNLSQLVDQYLALVLRSVGAEEEALRRSADSGCANVTPMLGRVAGATQVADDLADTLALAHPAIERAA